MYPRAPAYSHNMNATKKILFVLVLIGLFVVLMESAGWLALRKINGRWISPQTLVADLADATQASDENLKNAIRTTANRPSNMQQHILHPYLGFVRNPDVKQHEFVERTIPFSVNEMGFFGDSPIVKPTPDTFYVFLMGGSMALEFFFDAKEYFENILSTLPVAKDRTVSVISLALGGMKQPQQMLLLSYLFSLGAEPDLVITLDGYNEVVLPMAENIRSGVYPFFPRKWQVYGTSSINMDIAALVGAVANQRKEIEDSKAGIRRSWMQHSALGVAIWQSVYQRKSAKRIMAEQSLQKKLEDRAEVGHLPSQLRGPTYDSSGGKHHIVAECADLWQRSSLQMWQLCRARNIPFLQCLQPNQYVENSKPLTVWEMENAIGPKAYTWRIAATAGYPELIERGIKLVEAGMPYTDLTDVFSDVPETIYKDTCCHVNQRGAELMAERIGADLIAIFSEKESK